MTDRGKFTSNLGHLDAIRGSLVHLLESIDESEKDGAFEKGSIERMLIDLIKHSNQSHYDLLIAVIRKSNAKASATTRST